MKDIDITLSEDNSFLYHIYFNNSHNECSYTISDNKSLLM